MKAKCPDAHTAPKSALRNSSEYEIEVVYRYVKGFSMYNMKMHNFRLFFFQFVYGLEFHTEFHAFFSRPKPNGLVVNEMHVCCFMFWQIMTISLS